MAKADKATAVADITEQFKESTATVVTEYRGLTVANLTICAVRSVMPLPTPSPRTRWSSVPRRRRASRVLTTCSSDRPRSRSSRANRSTPPRRSRRSPRTTRRWSSRAATWTAPAVRRRGRGHRRPRVARGPAGQACRRDEGQPDQGRRPVQRPRVAGRPVGRRAAGEEGQRGSCVEAASRNPPAQPAR